MKFKVNIMIIEIGIKKSFDFLGVSEEAVNVKISQMFANLDVDGNGLISEEEFIQKCQEGDLMVFKFA